MNDDAFFAPSRLTQLERTVRQQLQQTYYRRLKSFRLKPPRVRGLQARVAILLEMHQDVRLSSLLAQLQHMHADRLRAMRNSEPTAC